MKPTKLLLLLLVITSCASKPSRLDRALQLAGENRPELEKVLSHYHSDPNDSLKYQAACFLIENMPYHYYYEGKLLDQFSTVYEALNRVKDASAVLDSLTLRFGNFSLNSVQLKHDITSLQSSYLIENIDLAFRVWEEQPWCKHIPFDQFCRFILPYRVNNEQPDSTRRVLYEKYNPLLDSLRQTGNAEDPLTAAQVLISTLSKEEKFFTAQASRIPLASPLLMDKYRAGSCRDMADLTVSIFRAVGIPSGIEFIPIHGCLNTSHCWTFILDKKGDTYTSDYLADKILPTKETLHQTAKIFRELFEVNQSLESEIQKETKSTPQFYRNPRFEDVTPLYSEKQPLTVTLSEDAWYDKKVPNVVYLCVSKFQEWEPISWTTTNNKQATFGGIKSEYSPTDTMNHGFSKQVFSILPKPMQTYFENVVFRVAEWKEESLNPLTDPFVVHQNGDIEFFTPREEKEQITVFSKFGPFTDGFVQHLPGGVFEGSNDKTFNKADTLHLISTVPTRLKNVVPINKNKKYRYARYKGAKGTSCGIAEIQLLDSNGNSINGNVISSIQGSEIPKHESSNAFDGDPYTSFYSPNLSDDWIGLDFGQPVEIATIVYSPRNRDNFIRQGDQYQLFYLNKEGWLPLGRQTATSDSLNFEETPSNTLLYLKNYTRGNDERIFIFKDRTQVFF